VIFSLAVKVCIATVVQSAYGADILLQMVYVVGGYKLTREQVLEWGRPHNLQPSEGNTTVCVNRWLKSQGIKTRLLACDYEGKCIFLVVTARKYDGRGIPNELEEDDRARGIKKEMKIDDVEFVTVADPYRYHH